MKVFKMSKNIEVVCEALKTRNGFKHTATLFVDGKERESVKICYLNRTWERYEYQSVLRKILNETKYLNDTEKKKFAKKTEEPDFSNEEMAGLKAIGAVAMMGDIFGKTQKEKNDWKVRMLKAGLENQGLIMPDDWDTLSEKEKEGRLNGAIGVIRK